MVAIVAHNHKMNTDFPLSTTLRVDHLTRNVSDQHLRDVFSSFGGLERVSVKVDPKVKLSMGWGLVQFKVRKDAEEAFRCMNLGQIDGKQIGIKFKELSLDQLPRSVPCDRRYVDNVAIIPVP